MPLRAQTNRRRNDRTNLRRRVNYSAQSGDRSYQHLGTANSLDLSGGGCRFQTVEPLPVGAPLLLSIQFGEVILRIPGRVVRSGPQRGLRWWGATGASSHSLGGRFETAVRFENSAIERERLQHALNLV